jgi:hypothetical protein
MMPCFDKKDDALESSYRAILRRGRDGWVGYTHGYGRQNDINLTFEVKHLRATCDSDPSSTRKSFELIFISILSTRLLP